MEALLITVVSFAVGVGVALYGTYLSAKERHTLQHRRRRTDP